MLPQHVSGNVSSREWRLLGAVAECTGGIAVRRTTIQIGWKCARSTMSCGTCEDKGTATVIRRPAGTALPGIVISLGGAVAVRNDRICAWC